MFEIVLFCKRPRQLQPMLVQIFTPTLAPVNPSLKITKRYLLKPIIPIITYYHLMLRRPDSKRRVDYSLGYPSDHNTICLFFFVNI
jgi:hypothetical protein